MEDGIVWEKLPTALGVVPGDVEEDLICGTKGT
jgi:hypothetical protein